MHVIHSVLTRLGSSSISSALPLADLLLSFTKLINSVVSLLVDLFSSFSKLTNCVVFLLGDLVS